MKILQINATCGVGSTGKICTGISELLTLQGVENRILYSNKTNGYPLGVRCATPLYTKYQALKSHLFGNYGFNSRRATKKMIREIDRMDPDIVHLHNIHGHDCHLPTLFTYFKKRKIKLVWTFHDCWTFTAYCPHFAMAKCDKWQSECSQCVQRREYSWLFDKSSEIFKKKKELFSDLDLTVVTPSNWLADTVKQSFFKDYPVKVIYNGIDLSVFQPTESRFRQKHGLENKKILLGVAFDWGVRKGLDAFVSLSETLPEDYQIVLVGTNDTIDKTLPKNIISIHRTQSQAELAEIYSAADLFVNPTREEVLGLTNIEALACGTPALTFRSGGSPECVDETCGSVVDCDDIDALQKEIIRICRQTPYSFEDCLQKARGFDKNERFKEYLELYERVNTERA